MIKRFIISFLDIYLITKSSPLFTFNTRYLRDLEIIINRILRL
jgi:hypothetical protein